MSLGAGGPVTTSQYALTDYYGHTTYTNLTGRTTESAALAGGQTTGVFVVVGQSLLANHAASGATNFDPGAALVQQINPTDGLCYRIKDPILGCSGTSPSMVARIADRLVVDGVYQRTIMIPVAWGGSAISFWGSTGNLNHRLRVAILRARQNGYPITGFLWEQGQSDSGTTKAAWKASFNTLVDTALGMGVSSPWFIAKCTFDSGAVNTTIQDAQTELWGTTYRGVNLYAGPDIDSLTGASNRGLSGNDAHLTDVGNAAAAVLWSNAINAVF